MKVTGKKTSDMNHNSIVKRKEEEKNFYVHEVIRWTSAVTI